MGLLLLAFVILAIGMSHGAQIRNEENSGNEEIGNGENRGLEEWTCGVRHPKQRCYETDHCTRWHEGRLWCYKNGGAWEWDWCHNCGSRYGDIDFNTGKPVPDSPTGY